MRLSGDIIAFLIMLGVSLALFAFFAWLSSKGV